MGFLFAFCCPPLNAVSFISSCFCSDRSALCGALQEVKHWNGEQDHSFATTTGWTGICSAFKPLTCSRSQLSQWVVSFELSWVCPVFVQINAFLQSFIPGLHLVRRHRLRTPCWIGQEWRNQTGVLALCSSPTALNQADNDYRNLKHCLSFALWNCFPFVNKTCAYVYTFFEQHCC